MSHRLPVVRAKEVTHVAEALGFVLDRQKGSHAIFYRNKDNARLVIPMHPAKTLKPKTLAGIIQDMGITVDEFQALL